MNLVAPMDEEDDKENDDDDEADSPGDLCEDADRGRWATFLASEGEEFEF